MEDDVKKQDELAAAHCGGRNADDQTERATRPAAVASSEILLVGTRFDESADICAGCSGP